MSIFKAALLATLAACPLFAPVAASAAVSGPADGPVTLLKSVDLPAIQGGFDHFAVDLKDNLLFVSAEKNKTLEMFRLRDGSHLASGQGYQFPHTSAYVPTLHQLFIADDDIGAVLVVDVPTLRISRSIPIRKGADEAVFDQKAGLFYVGCGGKHDNSDNSSISVIDVAQHREIARIPVPSTNIESIAVDRAGNRLFANLRDRKQVAVIDLDQKKPMVFWDVPGLNMNTPLLFDAKTQRVFVVGRKPGRLYVLDAASGKLLSTTDVAETADGMSYDDKNQRLYISGAAGLSVLHRDDADHFTEVQRLDSRTGKVSVYVDSLHQLYIAHAKTPDGPAALDIYKVAQDTKIAGPTRPDKD